MIGVPPRAKRHAALSATTPSGEKQRHARRRSEPTSSHRPKCRKAPQTAGHVAQHQDRGQRPPRITHRSANSRCLVLGRGDNASRAPPHKQFPPHSNRPPPRPRPPPPSLPRPDPRGSDLLPAQNQGTETATRRRRRNLTPVARPPHRKPNPSRRRPGSAPISFRRVDMSRESAQADGDNPRVVGVWQQPHVLE